MLNSRNLKDAFFLAAAVALFVGTMYIFAPYFAVLFVAIILVELFYPWYKYLKRKLRFEILASSLAGMTVILSVVIPVGIVAVIVFWQVSGLVTQVSDFWQEGDLVEKYNEVLADVNEWIDRVSDDPEHQLTTKEVQDWAINISEGFLNGIVSTLEASVAQVATFLTKLFVLLTLIFALFSQKSRLYKAIKRISPLEDELDDLFIRNFKEISKEVVLGHFFVAIGLGIIGGFAFWIVGIPAAVFCGLMMTVASLIPIGSGLIWIPTVAYLLIQSKPLEAAFIFVVGMLMTYLFDTLLRSLFTGGRGKINPLLLMIAILGGLEVMGIMGILYGPLIVVLFLSAMEVYKKKYGDQHNT